MHHDLVVESDFARASRIVQDSLPRNRHHIRGCGPRSVRHLQSQHAVAKTGCIFRHPEDCPVVRLHNPCDAQVIQRKITVHQWIFIETKLNHFARANVGGRPVNIGRQFRQFPDVKCFRCGCRATFIVRDQKANYAVLRGEACLSFKGRFTRRSRYQIKCIGHVNNGPAIGQTTVWVGVDDRRDEEGFVGAETAFGNVQWTELRVAKDGHVFHQ